MGEAGRQAREIVVDRSEGFGELLLGAVLDRAHEIPPQLIAPLVAEEAARIGGRDACILLQDYGQRMLRPLPGRGLMAPQPARIDGSIAGQAFLRMTVVEHHQEQLHRPVHTGPPRRSAEPGRRNPVGAAAPRTLPAGCGGAVPQVSEQVLQRGDRVLLYVGNPGPAP